MRQARRVTTPATIPGWSALVGALPRGLTDALPIWAIPPTMWLLAPTAFRAFSVFSALLPAMVGYQVFFALMASRLWSNTERLQYALSSLDYATARDTEIARTVRDARRVSIAVVLVDVALAATAIAIWWLVGGDWNTFPLIVVAASAACCATTLAYQHSIVASRSFAFRAAAAFGTVAIVGVLTQVMPVGFLAVYVLAAIAFVVVLLAANRDDWQQPEYSLFWAKAVDA